MRRAVLPLLLLLVAACSSTPPAGTVPPPPGPPGPVGRTLFNNMPISQGGGTLKYSKAGDPLDGLTITVPAAAYPTATTWTVTTDSSVLPTLPSGFSQVGPTLVIGNGQDFADSVMTLTMPMHLASNETVAPFYFDPVSKTLEGIPLVAGTDSSVTLATRHFTADEMVIPGTGASLSVVRSSLRAGFGSVSIVWVRTTTAQLVGTWSSTFLPGVDDWEFINYGDYVGPGGDCEGMSITAMFYHYYFHPSGGGGGLYHHYDLSLPNQWDNVQGIRFAGSVQGDYEVRFASGLNQVKTLVAQGIANGTPTKFLTASWITLTLQLTKQPVLLAMNGPIGGHAVVAYAATFDGTNTQVSFADPNRPGMVRSMAFVNGLLDPVPLQVNATAAPDYFTIAFALGVTAEVPLKQITSRWAEFVAKRAGSDRYPKQYHLQDSLAASLNWATVPVGDTVWMGGPIAFRHLCTDCPIKDVAGSDVQFVKAWNQAGNARLPGDTLPNPLPDGISSYLMVLQAWGRNLDNLSTGIGFVDAQPLTVLYHQLTVTAPPGMVPGVPITLTAHPGVLATFQSVYTWTFNDGGTPATATVVGDSTVTRSFPADGPFDVTVSLSDPVHAPLGLGTADVDVTFEVPRIRLFISGTWDPTQTPANGSYTFTDFAGARVPDGTNSGLDGLFLSYDLGTFQSFDAGVLLVLYVTAGAPFTQGETFSKVVSGGPPLTSGQFTMLLATDLHTPNSPQYVPAGTGTCTIDLLERRSDGSFAAHYSFTIRNGAGGTISGDGIATWK